MEVVPRTYTLNGKVYRMTEKQAGLLGAVHGYHDVENEVPLTCKFSD